MPVELNHTIVHAADPAASAAFMSEVFGLPKAEPFSPFLVIRTSNGVSLDYMKDEAPIALQHYAFLVSDEEFDQIFGRVRARGLDFWADPMGRQPGQINTHFGGRGVYFRDPTGHYLEIITRPYGSAT